MSGNSCRFRADEKRVGKLKKTAVESDENELFLSKNKKLVFILKDDYISPDKFSS